MGEKIGNISMVANPYGGGGGYHVDLLTLLAALGCI